MFKCCSVSYKTIGNDLFSFAVEGFYPVGIIGIIEVVQISRVIFNRKINYGQVESLNHLVSLAVDTAEVAFDIRIISTHHRVHITLTVSCRFKGVDSDSNFFCFSKCVYINYRHRVIINTSA